MSVVLCVDCTEVDELTLLNIRRIIKAVPRGVRVVVLQNAAAAFATDEFEVLNLTTAAILGGIAHHKAIVGGTVLPGNLDLKILAAAEALGAFEHLIRIEFDVMVARDVKRTVRDLIRFCRGADFSASYISFRTPENASWIWWDSLQVPRDKYPDSDVYLRGSFLPVAGFSREYLRRYRALIEDGWSGHYEVSMASAAEFLGMSKRSLSEGADPFTSFGSFNAHLIEAMPDPIPRLLHPVKDLAEWGSIAKRCEGRRFDLSRLLGFSNGIAPLRIAGERGRRP